MFAHIDVKECFGPQNRRGETTNKDQHKTAKYRCLDHLRFSSNFFVVLIFRNSTIVCFLEFVDCSIHKISVSASTAGILWLKTADAQISSLSKTV